jgi:hypothetical protein
LDSGKFEFQRPPASSKYKYGIVVASLGSSDLVVVEILGRDLLKDAALELIVCGGAAVLLCWMFILLDLAKPRCSSIGFYTFVLISGSAWPMAFDS